MQWPAYWSNRILNGGYHHRFHSKHKKGTLWWEARRSTWNARFERSKDDDTKTQCNRLNTSPLYRGNTSNKNGPARVKRRKKRVKWWCGGQSNLCFWDSVSVNTVVHTESEACQKQCLVLFKPRMWKIQIGLGTQFAWKPAKKHSQKSLLLSGRRNFPSASFVPAVSMGMMEGTNWVSARQARVTQHNIVA